MKNILPVSMALALTCLLFAAVYARPAGAVLFASNTVDTPPTPSICNKQCGDLDNDGNIDTQDYWALRRLIDANAYDACADVSPDGTLDAEDEMCIAQLLGLTGVISLTYVNENCPCLATGQRNVILLHLTGGWNLLSLPGTGHLRRGTCPKSIDLYAYLYWKGKWTSSYDLKVKIWGPGLVDYMRKHAFMVYYGASPGSSCDLLFELDDYTTVSELPLLGKGFNFVPVTYDMVGISIAELLANCNSAQPLAAWYWDGGNKAWVLDLLLDASGYSLGLEGSHVFSAGEKFTGFLVMANSSCNITNETYCGDGVCDSSSGENATSCPADCGNETCLDSDGGIDYYVAGNVTHCVYAAGNYTCAVYSDQCLNCSNSTNCTGGALLEYYCENSTVRSSAYNCSRGCANGSCLAVPCNNSLQCPVQMKCENSTCVGVGCVAEGGTIPGAIPPEYIEHMAAECCENLTQIAHSTYYDENCSRSYIVGAPSGVCTKCGNGVCESSNGETKCNCPADCNITGCVTPVDDLLITGNTTLCPGNYTLEDNGSRGVLIVAANNVVLDCNNARIIAKTPLKINTAGVSIGLFSYYSTAPVQNVEVKNCYIEGYYDGIELARPFANNTGITIRGNTVKKTSWGIVFNDADNSNIIGNVVDGNKPIGADSAIDAGGWPGMMAYLYNMTNYTTMGGSNSTTASAVGWTGIWIGGKYNRIASNVVSNTSWGIAFFDSHDTVENNEAYNNRAGIYTHPSGVPSSYQTVRNNRAYNNSDGLWLEGPYSSTFENNEIEDNIRSGISLHSALGDVFKNNIVMSNGDYGIYYFLNNENQTLENNTFCGHDEGDIYVSDSDIPRNPLSQFTLSNNTCNTTNYLHDASVTSGCSRTCAATAS